MLLSKGYVPRFLFIELSKSNFTQTKDNGKYSRFIKLRVQKNSSETPGSYVKKSKVKKIVCFST